MFRRTEYRWRAAEAASWIYKLMGVKCAPATLALVPPRVGVCAVRAGTLNVAVRQEPSTVIVEKLLALFFVDVPSVREHPNKVLNDLLVILGHRTGK